MIADRNREGQTAVGDSAWARYVNFVKLAHTVFALPFALVGVTLASYVAPVTVGTLGWIILAFTAARFAAMGFNRIVDRHIDARNPRTAQRELPRGAMSVRAAAVAVVVAVAAFFTAAWRLNPLCLALAPLAVAWVFAYSYTKRFTRWSHLVLGAGLGIAPVGGYLAVTSSWSDPWWMLVALAAGVMAWVAGFDILYALQDIEFDRREGLHSVPVAVGERAALTIARGLHLASVVALGSAGVAAGAGWIYGLGVLVAAALLVYEHSLVRVDDLSRLDAAFFTMNGIISIAFFGFVLAERLVRG
jgi:4-hydroxybenzoate polyprenyltransferase